MQVSAGELARIVRRASHNASPDERDAAEKAADAILQAQTSASLTSTGSRFLVNVAEVSKPYLGPRIFDQIRSLELYGVESAYSNAIPDISAAIPRIFVFEGLLQNLHYIIDLIKVLDRLKAARGEARFDLDGDDLPEALAFSMAGFSILSDALASQRFPATVHDILGPIARGQALHAYRLAVAFVILHELGHIELRHLANSSPRSERATLSLAEPELLSELQSDELAADAFALDSVEPKHRPEFMPSLVFFFAPFTFLEAFSGGLSTHHPLAVNRLSVLAARADMPEKVRAVIVGWIDGQLASLRQMAPERAKAGGCLRARIAERMPVHRAYKVQREIKLRVVAETGLLESNANTASFA